MWVAIVLVIVAALVVGFVVGRRRNAAAPFHPKQFAQVRDVVADAENRMSRLAAGRRRGGWSESDFGSWSRW